MDRTRTVVAVVLLSSLALAGLAVPARAQAHPPTPAKSYESLATIILGARQAEEDLVKAILEVHRGAAATKFQSGDFAGAAAEMALFANEGDNAVGGVRKRLLEGGHHHNAAGEEKG